MRHQFLLGAAVVALAIPAAASAQETTTTIRGTVSAGGAPVSGAEVVVTNVPSNTRSTTTTDASGGFDATGLRAGGPFTVEVRSPQGNTTVTDVFTVVGQPFDLPIDLGAAVADGGAAGPDIVVTAASIARAGVTSDGPQTVLGARDIAKVASINRDIRDVARRDPFATLDLANSRAVSFAGTNPRFNRFSVNGVQVGDNFGLNPDASPTGRGPIPFDALAQVSVSIAPYDFRQGNFQGGAIDATLLSGSNTFHGTGFYSINTDGLFGEQIGNFRRPVTSFDSETYGATFSGPIIADKLFFMVSAERNTEARPLAITSANQIPGLTDGAVNNVRNIARAVYGYETGGVIPIAGQKDEKIVGKIDWNITDNQRLALTYINAYDEFTFNQNTSQSATTPTIGLESNGYRLTELLRSGIVQLNSDWSDSFSTEARLLYKDYVRTQDPLLGRGFGQFQVCLDPTSVGVTTTCTTGVPSVFFGPDISRQSNAFDTQQYGGSLLANITQGDHQIRLLGEVSDVSIFNLFLQRSAGAFYFDSIADFQNRRANSLRAQNAVSLNINDAASEFGYQQYTFGAQDDWRLSDTLSVTYGARYDLYAMRSAVPFNANFLARTGYRNTRTYKGLDLFSPRISFDWKPTFGVKFRGGVGVFGGGSPDVYLSNSFSNTGIVTNDVTINRTAPGEVFNVPAATGSASLNGVTGSSIPAAFNSFLSTNTASLATAPVNALTPDFRLPRSLKATLSVDYNLFGFDIGADYIYNEVLSQVLFTDARSVRIGTLPDGRARYAARTNTGGISTTDLNTDIVLGNTGRGISHIWDVRFNRTFDFGVSLGGSYTWQDVRDASPATSSTAVSNYGNGAFDDPNFAAYGRSNDETRWQFKYNVGFDRAFFGDYRTAIQLFGETRSGRNFSYTMVDQGAGRSPVFGTLSNNNRYLLYVPTGTTDSRVSYDSAATQAALDGLIQNTELSKFRGRVAGRNIARSRAFTRIDLHLEQEVPTGIGSSRITLFGDIENLPNLINSEWGGLRQLGFPYTGTVIQVQCLQAPVATGTAPGTTAATGAVATASTQACAQYRYSAFRDPEATITPSLNNSLYLIRVGARFSF